MKFGQVRLLKNQKPGNTLLIFGGVVGNLVLLFLLSRSPSSYILAVLCVYPPELGATILVEPAPSPLQELTGDVIRDPRWEEGQTPRWRQLRFLSFMKTVISFLRPRAKASHHQTIYTFRFY